MFRLTEHALLRLTERIHALSMVPWDRSAIPVKRDPLQVPVNYRDRAVGHNRACSRPLDASGTFRSSLGPSCNPGRDFGRRMSSEPEERPGGDAGTAPETNPVGTAG